MTTTICYLDFNKICRICLESEKDFKSLITGSIQNMLDFCHFLNVFENDGLPSQICHDCEELLTQSYNFKQKCVSSHDILSQILEGNNIILDQTPIDNDDAYSTENIEFNIKQDIYYCKICDKSFLDLDNLQKHGDTHLTEVSENPSDVIKEKDIIKEHEADFFTFLNEQPAQSDLFKCVDCSDSFDNEYDLKLHASTHTTGEFVCINCNRICATRQMLRRHIKIHMVTKQHICNKCGKGFAESHSLTKHIRTHLGIPRDKKHICKVCGQGFSEPFYLKVHVRKHTGEKPLSCNSCGKCFSDPRSLKVHKMIHTGEKPYKCTICLKSFNQSVNLTKHVRTHTGERPYVCATCGKSFTQSSSLNKHSKIHSGERSYICELCGKKFRDRSTLHHHHEKIHADQKCSNCGKTGKYSCRTCTENISNKKPIGKQSK